MKRIDSTAWYKISRKARGAWHNALRGRGMVQDLELYVSRDESINEVAGVYAIGCSLCGHPQIVHGGITAMAFDDTFGLCYYTLSNKRDMGPGYTANLDVNYRKPMPCGRKKVLFTATVDRVEGRKVWMSAEATDEAGKTKYSEATALFVTARK